MRKSSKQGRAVATLVRAIAPSSSMSDYQDKSEGIEGCCRGSPVVVSISRYPTRCRNSLGAERARGGLGDLSARWTI